MWGSTQPNCERETTSGRWWWTLPRLDVARVEQDADSLADGRRREVVVEFGAHGSRVAVSSRDAAPEGADARLLAAVTRDLLVRLVDVHASLAHVEAGVFLERSWLEPARLNIFRLVQAISLPKKFV